MASRFQLAVNSETNMKALLTLLFVLITSVVSAQVLDYHIKTFAFTNDVSKGWTNNWLYVEAHSETNDLWGKEVYLEGKVNITDTNWTEVAGTRYLYTGIQTNVNVRQGNFKFYRAGQTD